MVEPVALHPHRATRAVQRMVEHAPCSGGLALWVHHRDVAAGVSPPSPPATTDGRTIFYAPSFEQLPLPRQAGIVAHVVLHIALRHAQRFIALQRRTGDADLQLFNVCADAIVNSALAHLGWLELPRSAVQLERLLLAALGLQQDAEAALLEWDVERLYRAIDDRTDASAATRSCRDGPRAAQVRALAREESADLAPGAHARDVPEDEAEAAREWSGRIQRAHAGDGAHSLLRALLADLPRERTPWEQTLRVQLAHALSTRPGISWSRPSRSYLANQGRTRAGRRLPWEPGRTASTQVPRLVVVVDVSGSIDAPLLDRFAREIESLSRRLEAGLVLVVGDDRVRRVETFEPGRSTLREIRFEGGGGTDFTPLLEEAGRHRPDIAVVLTDLQGPARCRPRWPVLWAVPEAFRDAVPPFGRLLALQ